jgi:hypothetical protein
VFIYTKHAIEKIDTLGIEKREVENAIKKGMKWKESNSEKWHAQMAGIEVVFMKQGRNIFIITAYFAGRVK